MYARVSLQGPETALNQQQEAMTLYGKATEAGPNGVQTVAIEGASWLQHWSLQSLKHERKHDQMRVEILLAQGFVQMNKARNMQLGVKHIMNFISILLGLATDLSPL